MNDADYKISNLNYKDGKTSFFLNDEEYEMNMLGKYNIYNLTVMIIILKNIGIPYEQIKTLVLDCMAPSGRMETITNGSNKIIIDYAHTPDAVKNIITAIKELNTKVVTIIGCGGNRDKTKRPEMAKSQRIYLIM